MKSGLPDDGKWLEYDIRGLSGEYCGHAFLGLSFDFGYRERRISRPDVGYDLRYNDKRIDFKAYRRPGSRYGLLIGRKSDIPKADAWFVWQEVLLGAEYIPFGWADRDLVDRTGEVWADGHPGTTPPIRVVKLNDPLTFSVWLRGGTND